MNKFLGAVCALFIGLGQLNAQCPTCTVAVPAAIPNDTIFLSVDSFPKGVQNQAYDLELSFRMPYGTSGLGALAPSGTPNVSIDHFTITSVSGMPPGMTFKGDRPVPMKYDDVSPATRDGCIYICGTPALSGLFEVKVNLAIQAGGGLINTTEIIPFIFEVAKDTSSTFSIDTNITKTFDGCVPFTLKFNNDVSDSAIAGITHTWDLGNGQTYVGLVPDSAVYTIADTGNVTISHEAIIDTFPYELVSVTVNSRPCSDDVVVFGAVVTTNDPEYYMILNDANGTEVVNTDPNNALTQGTNDAIPFSIGLSAAVVLDTAVNYTLQVWDDDNDQVGNADDQCGGDIIINTNGGVGTFNVSSNGLDVTYVIEKKSDTLSSSVLVVAEKCNTNVSYVEQVERSFQAFPNPTSDIVNVSFQMVDADKDIELVVSDVMGRKIFTEQINAFEGVYKNQISLGNQAQGIYLLQLRFGEKIMHKKVILSKQ